MNNLKNRIGIIFLFIIILLFVIGGYILMKYMTNDNQVLLKTDTKKENIDLRVDKEKDYLYYLNGEEFLEEAEIHKEDVVFNFSNLQVLNNTLHNELEEIYSDKNIVKISDVTIDENTEYTKNSKNIYSLKYREYNDTKYENYISLVILDFSYDVINESKIEKIKSYVVDKDTGDLISVEKLLNTFNITEDVIINKVKERLENTQVLDGDSQIIDIDGTINSIKNSSYQDGIKALSISKTGKLVINFIVKSNKINYNDSVELN